MKDNQARRFSEEMIVVYRSTIDKLYRFVSRRAGGSRELAEDVTQETYLRAVAAWHGTTLPDCPLAWLQTVARNLLLNHWRRRQPQLLRPADVDTVLASTAYNGAEAAAVVCWGLARLGTRHARLLEEFYIDDKPVRIIAQDFGVTERAIEGRLRRARLALKKLLLSHADMKGE